MEETKFGCVNTYIKAYAVRHGGYLYSDGIY